MDTDVVTHSVEETLQLGEQLAGELHPGDIVCLEGELGAGKTHFVKGLARGYGINPSEVSSPTFTLIHEYHGTMPLFHFDCYRMESEREALEIGAEEYFYDEGVSVIEWPSRIEGLLPEHVIWVTIESIGPSDRRIRIRNSEK